MYQLLMGLPLFSGVTYEKMLEIIGNTKFHFLKFLGGETFIAEGEQCTHIKFIISGKVRVSIANHDRRFTVSQTLTAPDVVAPEYIFGRSTVYPCSVVALEPTGVLQISKADYMKILNSDPIFLINYLNLLSMNAQKAVDGILSIATGSLEERIAFWIVALTQRGGSDITMTCRQRDLYSLFGVQRSSFISTLDDMKARGLIDYSQTEIRVRNRRDLIDILHSTVE
ncbi:MAG: Crp/Fnr family transcriptional regulator [Muribaculaceae bacterium]|nr:Crp/Fnr family transcriptional regulator [Muribaculaceae bacterium]MDE6756377.1 Crp/Fnr family transcriptional regulator [Muribaculaceae bacterium]